MIWYETAITITQAFTFSSVQQESIVFFNFTASEKYSS